MEKLGSPYQCVVTPIILLRVISYSHTSSLVACTLMPTITDRYGTGKHSREKTFANFALLWLFVKLYSAKFGSMKSIGVANASNLQKFSPRKSYFSLVPI